MRIEPVDQNQDDPYKDLSPLDKLCAELPYGGFCRRICMFFKVVF